MKQWISKGVNNNPNHDRVFSEAGITGEQVWIQPTPMGTFAIACWDVESPEKAFGTLITSKDPWAADFRQVLTRAHGIDFSQPMSPNERIGDWNSASAVQANGQYGFILPLQPGKEATLRKWIAEEANSAEHNRMFAEGGVDREQTWLQHTPMGDIVINLLNTDNAAKAFSTLAASRDPWAVKFRAFLLDVYGVDFSQPVPINHQAARWTAKERVRA